MNFAISGVSRIKKIVYLRAKNKVKQKNTQCHIRAGFFLFKEKRFSLRLYIFQRCGNI